MSPNRILPLLAILPCVPASARAPDPAAGRAPAPRIYAIFEPVLSESDAELVGRLRPDLLCRGWFKWKDARDYAQDAAVVSASHAAGSLRQRRVPIPALYPDENGLDEATFLDYATRGPDGEIVPVAGWFHVALHNPAVREYIKGFVHRQIDAGADGIWFDEIEGIYGWMHEGYDDYAIRAFADYLHRVCVEERGWAQDDPRFRTELGIDLARCGGDIRAFDYRQWLAETPGPDGAPLAADPWAGAWDAPWDSANPLYRLWGHAWRPDPRLADTFQARSVREFWAEFVRDAREYARERYGRELVVTCNENGTPRPYVDFQQPHDGALPQVRADGRLDTSYRALPWLDERLRLAEDVTPGKPVVQFVDWPGETDRLVALSREDTLAFLYTYIPEAYAAGALFAPPVRGYVYDCVREGVLPETAEVLDYLRRYDGLLFDGSRPSAATVDTGDPDIVARVRESDERVIVHLVDHRPVDIAPAGTPLRLRLPAPASRVWTVALHSPLERVLIPEERADAAYVDLPAFRYSALVVLERFAPRLSGTVRDGYGRPVAGARVTHTGLGRTLLTDETGVYAFAGAEPGTLCVTCPGYAGVVGPGPDFTLRRDAPVALTGRFEDSLGCVAPLAEVSAHWTGGSATLVTDVAGAFSFLVPATKVTLIGTEPSTGATARLVLEAAEGMAPVTLRTSPPERWVGDFERGPLWTPNDSSRHAGGDPVLHVARVNDGPHGDSRCMEVTFDGLRDGGWANAYSSPVDLSRHDAIRLWYRGDGQPGDASLCLHAHGDDGDRFFTFPLPLARNKWDDAVVFLSEFRHEGRAPTEGELRSVSVQIAFAGTALRPATVRVWGVRAISASE